MSVFSISPARKRLHLVGREALRVAALAQRVDDPYGHILSEIGAYQFVLQCIERLGSSGRCETIAVMEQPSDDDVRLRPPLSRFHQFSPCVLSFMPRT